MPYMRNVLFGGLAALLAQGVSSAAFSRVATTTFNLYAYGEFNASGGRVFYGDGEAYVGTGIPTGVSEALNITFTLNQTSQTITVAPDNSTSVTWTSDPVMYIDTGTDASSPVSFSNSSSIAAKNSTVGFGMYDGFLFHETSGNLQTNFFVSSTDDAAIYKLSWYAAGPNPPSGIPVSVRSVAPIPPEDTA